MNKAVILLSRVLVGALFVFSGALKIFDPQLFAHGIAQYHLVPHPLVNLMAITLPWIEYSCGLLLVLGVWVRASALLVTALCLVFAVAIGSVLARGLKIDCSCFGTVGSTFVDGSHLALDVALLIVAAWLLWRAKE